jgi:hypothetical protein
LRYFQHKHIAVPTLKDWFIPKDITQLNISWGDQPPSEDVSSGLMYCIPRLHKDIKNYTDYLSSSIKLSPKSRERFQVWVLESFRFQMAEVISPEMSIKGTSPTTIALQDNDFWPWVGDGLDTKVLMPIVTGNCLKRENSLTGEHITSLDNYALGFAHVNKFTAPDLFLKNLALCLEEQVRGKVKGSTLVIYGVPPMSFISWLKDLGTENEFKQLEKVSPIPNVDIIMAVPMPGLGNLTTPERYAQGNFLFRLKSSIAPQKIALNNQMASFAVHNIYDIWKTIRSFTLIQDVIDHAWRGVKADPNSNILDQFWGIIFAAVNAPPARTEIVRKKINPQWIDDTVPQLTQVHIDHLTQVAKTGTPAEKAKTENVLKKNKLFPPTVGSLASFIVKVQNQFRGIMEKPKAEFVGFNLDVGHIVDDVLKGYSYTQTFPKIESISPTFLEENLYYQEHGVRHHYMLEIKGDKLHAVKRHTYLSCKMDKSSTAMMHNLLLGFASLVGRIAFTEDDITYLCQQLADVLKRYKGGCIGHHWLAKCDEMAFGSVTGKESMVEHLDMQAIETFKTNLKTALQTGSPTQDGQAYSYLTEEQTFGALLGCFFYKEGDQKLTVGEWLEFLDTYSRSTDTPLDTIPSNPTSTLCLALLSKGCNAIAAAAPGDAGLLYFIDFVTSHIEGVVKLIYVVKPNNDVLVGYESTFGDGVRPAHSQLAGGAGVKGAGELIFRKTQGQWLLEEINNGSGHYRPPSDTLEKARSIIQPKLGGTAIGIPSYGIQIRNCLFPGMPALS